VTAVALLAQCDRQRQEVGRAPLERQRQADGEGRLLGGRDRGQHGREVSVAVVGEDAALEAGGR
jgi:hypothetical protein